SSTRSTRGDGRMTGACCVVGVSRDDTIISDRRSRFHGSRGFGGGGSRVGRWSVGSCVISGGPGGPPGRGAARLPRGSVAGRLGVPRPVARRVRAADGCAGWDGADGSADGRAAEGPQGAARRLVRGTAAPGAADRRDTSR